MTILLLFLAVDVAIVIFLAYLYRAPDMSQYDTPVAPLVKPASEVSPQHQDVLKILEKYHREGSRLSTRAARIQMEELFGKDVDAVVTPVDVDGIPGEWVMAEGADPKQRLLYLHGGAFRVGSPTSHRYITSEISRRSGSAVLAIDYRMQPEYKTIHCHEDARTAYRWILNNGPEGQSAPEHLFVAGDSAGGNMTLAVIAWARDNGLTPATGAIGLAPLTDSSLNSPSWKTNLETDPFLGPGLGVFIKVPKFVIAIVSRFSNGKPVNDPELSPLLGDLSNLPPTLLQVSRHEMLFDDSQRYTNKGIVSGSKVELQVWPTMVHVFQGFGPELPEAVDALEGIAVFVRQLTAE
ncbi:MAG: alpha/beta hydrolase [bacterium]